MKAHHRAMLATTLLCLVIGVSDGDTLRARCGEADNGSDITVRLAGIDAPEYLQDHGKQAYRALRRLTLGKTARLHCHKIDAYQRSVCSVWIAPDSAPGGPLTLDAGHAMLTLGMAWWYRAYAHEQTPQERGQYAFSQEEARLRGAGLWADPQPMPPWQWRALHRTP